MIKSNVPAPLGLRNAYQDGLVVPPLGSPGGPVKSMDVDDETTVLGKSGPAPSELNETVLVPETKRQLTSFQLIPLWFLRKAPEPASRTSVDGSASAVM